jgi:hypothetical protein
MGIFRGIISNQNYAKKKINIYILDNFILNKILL